MVMDGYSLASVDVQKDHGDRTGELLDDQTFVSLGVWLTLLFRQVVAAIVILLPNISFQPSSLHASVTNQHGHPFTVTSRFVVHRRIVIFSRRRTYMPARDEKGFPPAKTQTPYPICQTVIKQSRAPIMPFE